MPKPNSFPIPDYLQWAFEKNMGKKPVWHFPAIPESPEGFRFIRLTFENRSALLDAFKNDPDEWVGEYFKNAKGVYEFVCLSRIVMPYSFKAGGADWLVSQAGNCLGILHAFEFSKEQFGYSHRCCSIGYAFAEKYRGTGIPQKVVRYFQNYLFQKMNLLYLSATVDKKNIRSIRFLKSLGYTENISDKEGDISEKEEEGIEDKNVILELFRSVRSRNKITAHRREARKEYRAWQATWVKQEDGSYTSI